MPKTPPPRSTKVQDSRSSTPGAGWRRRCEGEWLDNSITGDKLAPAGEVPGCVIQEIGYQIHFEGGETVTPLTTILTISEEERSDPRVSLAIDEMMA